MVSILTNYHKISQKIKCFDLSDPRSVHYADDEKKKSIFSLTTLIRHEKAWDDAIGELTGELRKEGLNARQFLLTRNGDGTNGHPRISEQAEMARELAEELKRVLKLA